MKTNIYFEAAQLLPAADGERHPMREDSLLCCTYGCCDAIEAACNRSPHMKDHDYFVDEFIGVFKPPYATAAYWFDYTEEESLYHCSENRYYEGNKDSDEENCANARVLALLFMHWMTINP